MAGPATWITLPTAVVATEVCIRYSKADAPLTTSMISRVMLAWRTRFMYSVRLSITSPRCWLPSPSLSCARHVPQQPFQAWRCRLGLRRTWAAETPASPRPAARRCSRPARPAARRQARIFSISQFLRNYALELVVDDVDRIDLFVGEAVDDLAGDSGRIRVGGLVENARYDRRRSDMFAGGRSPGPCGRSVRVRSWRQADLR